MDTVTKKFRVAYKIDKKLDFDTLEEAKQFVEQEPDGDDDIWFKPKHDVTITERTITTKERNISK